MCDGVHEPHPSSSILIESSSQVPAISTNLPRASELISLLVCIYMYIYIGHDGGGGGGYFDNYMMYAPH